MKLVNMEGGIYRMTDGDYLKYLRHIKNGEDEKAYEVFRKAKYLGVAYHLLDLGKEGAKDKISEFHFEKKYDREEKKRKALEAGGFHSSTILGGDLNKQ